MLRQMVVRPAAALPAPAPDAVDAESARDAAYAMVMSARCALARVITAGHREPPRHRAA